MSVRPDLEERSLAEIPSLTVGTDRVLLGGDTPVCRMGFTAVADAANTGVVWVGENDSVAVGGPGFPLAAGTAVDLDITRLTRGSAIATTAGNKLHFLGAD